ncbi:MAG: MBL fold metallo-hydrolase [Clostridia bacterium]|nr:MBL fold metallo-hydrolase [Clostridia bacterium]
MKKLLFPILILFFCMMTVSCVGNDHANDTESETPYQTEPTVTMDDTVTEEITHPSEQPTENESGEVTTKEPTEDVTDSYQDLPADISLPEGYGTANVVYECDDGSVLYVYKNKAIADYRTVCDTYVQGGYAVYHTSDSSKVPATTFVGNGPMAHVYFSETLEELNIVISSDAAKTLPPVTPAVSDGAYTCTVAQLKDNVNVNGMSYIIQLKDGSFIVYDGGYQGQAMGLLNYLRDAHDGDGKPVIRAWVLTHSHNDHYPVFTTFATTKSLRERVIVEHVIFAPMNDAKYDMPNDDYDAYFSTKLYDDVKNFEGVKLVFAHTGMEFKFCNLNMEILFSPESLYKEKSGLGNFNDTSIVSRLYGDGYSALFLADIGNEGTAVMKAMYGDYLKSDMCQASHHGIEACHVPLYDIVQPQIMFYPCNLWLYNADGYGREAKVEMENKDYVKEILIAGCNTFVRDWGTKYGAEDELRMPDYNRPDSEEANQKTEPVLSDRLVMEKDTFEVGEAINVIAKGTGKDWIGIQKINDFNAGAGSAYWWYIVDIGSGNSFNLIGSTDGAGKAVNLPAGEYVIRLIENDAGFLSKDPVAHMYFKIVDSTSGSDTDDSVNPEGGACGVEGKFTLNKTVYENGEAIMATASAGTKAWLELHYEQNGSYVGFGWRYVGDGGITVDEAFDLRNVVYTTGTAYSFKPGKYKIIWYPADDRSNGVVVEFEIQ